MKMLSFADQDVNRRTRKGHFLDQMNQLIDWNAIDRVIQQYYKPVSDAIGRPAYPGLLLFKMLLVGIWHGGLGDEAVEDMANANLYIVRFLGLSLEDDVPDHSVLSRFRTKLSQAKAWDGLLNEVNRQIEARGMRISQGCHVDASITPSQRKPHRRPAYEVVEDREAREDESEAKAQMRVIKVEEPRVDPDGRWVKKGGESQFGYKQHTLVDDHGLVLAVETTEANCHDSRMLIPFGGEG